MCSTKQATTTSRFTRNPSKTMGRLLISVLLMVLMGSSLDLAPAYAQPTVTFSKAISTVAPVQGSNFTYTVTMMNSAGMGAATGVTFTDALPAATTFVSSTCPGSYDGGADPICEVGNIPDGGVVVVVITVNASGAIAAPVTNTVTAAAVDAPGIIAGVPAATPAAAIAAPSVDLVVSKVASTAAPQVGVPFTYTITVTNTGANQATNVLLNDVLPVGGGLTFGGSTCPGTYDGGANVGGTDPNCELGTIAGGGGSASFVITVTPTAAGGFTNTASATADQVGAAPGFAGDTTPADNTSSVTLTSAVNVVDLTITKTASTATPKVGVPFTYTITVTNAGPSVATDVVITDGIPGTLTFNSSTCPAYAPPGDINSEVGNIVAGGSFMCTITVTPTAVGPVANGANVTANEADSNPADNATIHNTNVTVDQADLVVTKTSSNATPFEDETFVYTITVMNNGPDAAANVVVTDLLDGDLTVISETCPDATYDGGVNVGGVDDSCDLVASLASGASAVFTITVQADVPVPPTNAIANTAVVSSTTSDPDGLNNSSTVNITAQNADADLEVIKTAPTNVKLGTPFIYTIDVNNLGPRAAQSVTVTDLLPPGLTFNSSTCPGSYDGAGDPVCEIGTITAGGTFQIVINVTPTVLGAIGPNTATVASTTDDPALGNNTSAAVIVTSFATLIDLELTKTASVAAIKAGDNFTYTITVTNQGPDTATGVDVTDLLPAGLTFVSSTCTGTYDGAGDPICEVGSIPAGATRTFDIVVTAVGPPPLTVTNDAEVSAAGEMDTDSTPGNAPSGEDDEGTVDVAISATLVDVSVTKVASTASPIVGSPFTYTITVTNAGPDIATDVVATDVLPAGVTFVSSTCPGTYDGVGDTMCELGTLNPGASIAYTITVIPTATGNIMNTVTTSQNETDGDASNDTAMLTLTVGASSGVDIAVTKVASTATPALGVNFTYTITVTNNGPDAATNVTVTDALAAGLTFIGSTCPGTYNGGADPVCEIGALASGASTAFTITVNPTALGLISNTATGGSTEADNNPANNSGSVDVTVGATAIDLAVTKVASNPAPNVGNAFTYTVTVTNNGPNAATNVVVTDVLPPTVTFVGSTCPGTYNGGADPVCELGALANGASIAFTITVNAAAAGSGNNTATASASEADTNGANNSSTAVVNIGGGGGVPNDMTVTKTVNNPVPNPGDIIVFTITAFNPGPGTQSQVVINDPLPAGLNFISAVASDGSVYNVATGECPIGDLLPGETVTLTITAQVDPGASGLIVNSTFLTCGPVAAPKTGGNSAPTIAACVIDPNLLNNLANVIINIGGAGGGGGAGIESNGELAVVLGQRQFKLRNADRFGEADKQATTLFQPATAETDGEGALANFLNIIPETLMLDPDAGTFSAAVVSTPTDLLDVSRATSVFAVDYPMVDPTDTRLLGAIFAASTPAGQLYDHTKITCDRLAGAMLSDIQVVEINGVPFIMDRLEHANGTADFAVSFAVYTGGAGYTIEHNFAYSQYQPQGDGEVLNFQVWAAVPEYTVQLVEDILDNLESQGPLSFIGDAQIPDVYVRNGRYEGGDLILDVVNLGGATTMNFEGRAARTEQGLYEDVSAAVSLGAGLHSEVVLSLGTYFSFQLKVTSEQEGVDEIYFADGQWAHSEDANTTVSSFETGAESRAVEEGYLNIARDVDFRGTLATNGWMSTYRWLRAGGFPVDLSAYEQIQFTLSGNVPNDQVRFVLQKESIANGEDQFGLDLDGIGSIPQVFTVNLSDLKRPLSAAANFTGEDAELLAFYVSGGGSFQLEIEDIRFVDTDLLTPTEDTELPDQVTLDQNYPNPFNPTTAIQFALPQTSDVRLVVYDVMGRQVRVLADGVYPAGAHQVLFEASGLASGTYIYRLQTPHRTLVQKMILMK